MRVKVKSKVIPTSFLKIEVGDVRLGETPEKEGRLVESVGNQNPGPKAPPRSQDKMEQRKCHH